MKRNLSIRKSIISMCVIFSVAVSSNSSSYAWDSKEYSDGLSTHSLIVEQGLNIMKSDLPSDYGSSAFNVTLSEFEKHIEKLKEGSVAPDFGEKNYVLYQDHFYDPDTRTNFTIRKDGIVIGLDYVYETALSRFQQYYGEALYKWRQGSYSDAVYKLGIAFHYLSDICTPHHSNNYGLGGIDEPTTKHSTFETQVENNKENFRISSLGSFNKYEAILQEQCIPDMIQTIAHDYARQSKPYFGVLLSDYNNNFNTVASETMTLAQESAARFIFRFIVDVANATSASGNENCSITVRIRTKDVWLAGTDDYVYFGMELKDGRISEHLLDKSGYNDFERDDDDSYTVSLPASSGAEINRVWIRKWKPAASASDGWHIRDIFVSGDGINVYKNIDHDIDDNYGFYMKISDGTMEQYPVY